MEYLDIIHKLNKKNNILNKLIVIENLFCVLTCFGFLPTPPKTSYLTHAILSIIFCGGSILR